MSPDEDIQDHLVKYENLWVANLKKVMLYHKLELENLKIISDKTNYLDMDTAKIPIVEFVCDKCNLSMENRQFPSKVDLFCINCNQPYP